VGTPENRGGRRIDFPRREGLLWKVTALLRNRKREGKLREGEGRYSIPLKKDLDVSKRLPLFKDKIEERSALARGKKKAIM